MEWQPPPPSYAAVLLNTQAYEVVFNDSSVGDKIAEEKAQEVKVQVEKVEEQKEKAAEKEEKEAVQEIKHPPNISNTNEEKE
jgi:coenzyme F420-reducing hydrogenase beta subunit